jgi:hypothetical protein
MLWLCAWTSLNSPGEGLGIFRSGGNCAEIEKLWTFALQADYEKASLQRYPDPAYLLPISVDACIFVQTIPDSALTWC